MGIVAVLVFAVSSPCLAQEMRLDTLNSWSGMDPATVLLAVLSLLMPCLMISKAFGLILRVVCKQAW